MSLLKTVLVIAALAFASFSFSSCDNAGDAKVDKTEQNEKLGKEYTSAYVCPMHCEGSGSDKEGKCPKCKMDYIKNEDHKH